MLNFIALHMPAVSTIHNISTYCFHKGSYHPFNCCVTHLENIPVIEPLNIEGYILRINHRLLMDQIHYTEEVLFRVSQCK